MAKYTEKEKISFTLYRFRNALRLAILCYRMGKNSRAYYHLGQASASASMFYDLDTDFIPFHHVTKVRKVESYFLKNQPKQQ